MSPSFSRFRRVQAGVLVIQAAFTAVLRDKLRIIEVLPTHVAVGRVLPYCQFCHPYYWFCHTWGPGQPEESL